MTLEEMIRIVNEAYPDGMVKWYHDHPGRANGDTLAEFVAEEISESFLDYHKGEMKALGLSMRGVEDVQLDSAISVMERARDEIQGVIDALLAAKEKWRAARAYESVKRFQADMGKRRAAREAAKS